MRPTKKFINPIIIASLTSSTFLFGYSIQLAASDSLALEEIVVTARKREENLQDVPVSVNAISGDKLAEAGISRIGDLSSYVPNLTLSETGLSTTIYIRGIGSGINQGFEQSVGMYVDGIYYGRAQLARAPFLDLEQVEVLRGPQGVLFGKNSIAGAVSMQTAKPTQEFESSFSVLYEPELSEKESNLIFSGPVSDTLSARVAFRSRDSDGYIKNDFLKDDEPRREELTMRSTVLWEATDDLAITFKAEVNKFDVDGRQIEIIDDKSSVSSVGLFTGKTYGQILNGVLGQDSSVLNSSLDGIRSSNGDFSYTDTKNFTMNVNYGLGENNLTLTSGYMSYDYEELCDCDFTSADVFSVQNLENYDQLSQEVRLTSPSGETFDYLAGVFYQSSNLDFGDRIDVSPESIIGVLTGPNGLSVRAPRTFKQDNALWALFGQVTWNATDTTRLNLGGRFTGEKKDATRTLIFENLDGTALQQPKKDGTIKVFADRFQAEQHALAGDRSETAFTPAVSLQHDLDDNTMLYTSVSRGYKSGGYDVRSNTAPGSTVHDGTWEFEEEEATSFEIGSKMTLLDGSAELNTAVFLTKYDDMQMSIYDGVLGFNVKNAGKSTTQGVEVDGRWRLNEAFTLVGALAYLDFTFDDFDQGECYFGQTPDNGEFCSYDGKTNQFVAPWSGSFSGIYQKYFNNLVFRTNLDLLYSDDYLLSQNLDPSAVQDAFLKLNAQISLGDAADSWTVAFVGKNLTDEEIITYANDTPLAGANLGSTGHYGFIDPPRTVALQGLLRF